MFLVPTPHYLSDHLPGMEPPFFFSPRLKLVIFSFSLTHKDLAAHRQGYRVNQPFIWAPIALELCAAKKTSVSHLCQLMVNCRFGSWWFGIRIRIPLFRNNPFHFRGSNRSPNHWAINY